MADEGAQGGRPGLDKERVVRVALELLDAVGLDDLSMRRLAERLGVTAASLYWYVRNKDELLELLADAISAEMPLPDPAQPWREELTAYARAVRGVALAHRDAARLLAATIPSGPQRLRRIDALFAVLRRAGFHLADAADAGHLLNVYVMGFVLDEILGPQAHTAGSTADEPAMGAPLGMLRSARLLVQRGAANLTIDAGAPAADLYAVTFEGREPEVEERAGTVRLRQRHGRRTSCTVALNAAIPWEIAVEGGAARLTANLTRLRLAGFRISGGISDTMLRLPHPETSVPLHIDGGLHRVTIERPAGVPIRVHLSRGSHRLTLDGMRLGAVGGGTDWESPGYTAAPARYDLHVGSGANELAVATASDEPATTSSPQTLYEQVRRWFAALPADEYPNLTALAEHLSRPDQDHRFQVGLQMVLDGLERRLAADD